MKKQSLNTLKDYAKFRILNDMIESIKKKSGDTLGYYILVVDPESVKVLSSICGMYDLISYKISTVEQLTLERKRFPNADAIYLISPTKASVDRVLHDFKDPALPQYNFVHLSFMGPLPEELMAQLAQSPGLVPRIKTLRELNINFLIKESDVFHFGSVPNLSLYTAKDSSLWCSTYAEKLLTVCCAFLEVPYIQYYGDSSICKELATTLHRKMGELVKKAGKDMRPHDPRGTVIILDRSYDISAPAMHDYCYEVIIHDLFSVSKENAIDLDNMSKKWADEEEKKLSASDKKVVFLGDKDPLWKNYRFMHIGEVFKKLGTDMKEFAKANKKMDTNTEDLDKLQEMIATMPGFKETMGSYQSHTKLSSECSKVYKERNYMDLIKLEQQIVTGLDEDGSELDTKKVATAIGRLPLEFKSMSEEDKLRIYLMYLANYDVPKKEAESFCKEFTNQKYREIIFSKLVWLGHKWPGSELKKPQRKEPKMKREDFEISKQRAEQSKMAEIMYIPKVAKVAMEASRKTLSTDDFPFIGEVPEGYGKKQIPKPAGMSIKKGKPAVSIFSEEKGAEDLWSQPRLIIFVIGGMSYQEKTALFKLQQAKKINCPITIGSDTIITPKEFIESLDRIGEFQLDMGDI